MDGFKMDDCTIAVTYKCTKTKKKNSYNNNNSPLPNLYFLIKKRREGKVAEAGLHQLIFAIIVENKGIGK